MMPLRLNALFLALMVVAQTCPASPTLDEISGYLGISPWTSHIELNSQELSLELWRFKKGKIVQLIAKIGVSPIVTKDRRLAILIGPQGRRSRVFMRCDRYETEGCFSLISKSRGFTSVTLPSRLTPGDYPLFGTLRFFGPINLGSCDSYTEGIMLRIRIINKG